MSLKRSKSVSNLSNEEEIKAQYVKPIGGNTLPPQYSKEISRYQPSEKERVKAMKDASSAVRQFTSEGNSKQKQKSKYYNYERNVGLVLYTNKQYLLCFAWYVVKLFIAVLMLYRTEVLVLGGSAIYWVGADVHGPHCGWSMHQASAMLLVPDIPLTDKKQ